jgi:plasmid stability protein
MATLTIRNLPEDLVARLKRLATKRARSMEQEVRELLLERYGTQREIMRRVRERWAELPPSAADEVDAWIARTRREAGADGV